MGHWTKASHHTRGHFSILPPSLFHSFPITFYCPVIIKAKRLKNIYLKKTRSYCWMGWCWYSWLWWCLWLCSVVGVPSLEDWPQNVGLPQTAFAPRPPKPIEDLVPDMDELGRSLLLVSSLLVTPNNNLWFLHIGQLLICIFIALALLHILFCTFIFVWIWVFGVVLPLVCPNFSLSLPTAIPFVQSLQKDIGLCCSVPPLLPGPGQSQ